MRVPGYVELSAICTHPAARGRGLASQLARQLMEAALNRGEMPFLHVRAENKAAVSLYKCLGFEVRREMWIVWCKPAAN
jgi:predicted GNAT family acetyltransferase